MPRIITATSIAIAGLLTLTAGAFAASPDPSDQPATTSAAASADPVADPARQRLLFSTDLALGLVNGRFDGPGAPPIDDAYAVALAAAASDRFDIRGLVITHGNAIMAPEHIAASRLVETLGLDIPVLYGAAVPLANPPVHWFDGEPSPSGA